MSRIIKEGTLEERILDCPKCGCRFGYNIRDIWSERYEPPIIGCSDEYYVECPYCKAHLRLSDVQQSRKHPNRDFMEDAQALAKQYGLKITKLEVE